MSRYQRPRYGLRLFFTIVFAIIAGFVLVEKVSPSGIWMSRASGILFIVLGLWVAIGHWFDI